MRILQVAIVAWCCRSLQIFRADIVGVPRSEVRVQHSGQPVEGALHTGTVGENRDIQRRDLEQLGALTELEDLCLFSSEVHLQNHDVLVFDGIRQRAKRGLWCLVDMP